MRERHIVLVLRVMATVLGIYSLVGCSNKPAPTPTTPAAGSNALPSSQGEFPGITATIQEVRRSSNTVTLKLAMSNQSKENFSVAYSFGEGGSLTDFNSVAGIHLIDTVNKKSYLVMRDSNGACECSRNIGSIAPGSQSVVWAKFEAPPDDLQKITVAIPHFPPFEDVPISH